MDTINGIPLEDIKSLICKIPDIMQCNIICGSSGKIQEIHVLAGMGRGTKQLVRDIQSAINARYDIEIDYKIISIAQINEAEFKESRIRIDSIAVRNVDNSIEAAVYLENGNQIYEGRSTKVKSKINKAKAVAEATLNALESYLNVKGIFYLEGLDRYNLSGKEVFVALIGFSHNNEEEFFTGSSFVSVDENESVVKSVLSALNRRMGFIGL